MHYYSFNIPDWTVATAHLSLEEQAVYFRLVNHYYDTEQPIPLETQSVIRRLRLGSHEKVLESVLAEFFTKTEKGFVNARCERELKEYRKLVKKNRENGAKGGRPRKNKDLPSGDEKPTGNPLGTDSEPTGNPPNNHSLLPIPKGKKGFAKPSLSELILAFNTRVPDASIEANRFFNYYESNGWKVGRNAMKSWPHAVTNWISNRKPGVAAPRKSILDHATDTTWAEGLSQ